MVVVALQLASLMLWLGHGSALTVLSQRNYLLHTRQKTWQIPSCICISRNDSIWNRTFFEKAVTRLKERGLFTDFKFYYVEQGRNAMQVKCHLGRDEPEVYHKTSRKSKEFYKWLRNISETFENSFPVLTTKEYEHLSKVEGSYLILAFPGSRRFAELEFLLEKVWNETSKMLRIYIVPSNSEVERHFVEKGTVIMFPSLLLFYRKVKHRPLQAVADFKGNFELTEANIKLALLKPEIGELEVHQDHLPLYMSNDHYLVSPLLLLVYSQQDQLSYRFAHAFQRSRNHFRDHWKSSNFQFFTVDISNIGNSVAFASKLKIHGISVPGVLLIYRNRVEDSNRWDVLQAFLSAIPTPYILERFLNGRSQLTLPMRIRPLSIVETFQMCSPLNGTNTCLLGDPLHVHTQSQQSVGAMIQKKKKRKQVKRIVGIEVISEGSWDTIFSSDSLPTHHFVNSKLKPRITRSVIVIFISGDCSYCQLAMPQFQQVAAATKLLAGVSIFLMNCSVSKSKCEKYHVTGYPTIIMFQMQSSYQFQKCLPHQLLSKPVQINYHGNFEVEDMMQWISKHINPNLFVLTDEDARLDMVKDIQLTAWYHTKRHVREYLPLRLRDKVVPMRCVQLLCELFYLQMDCYAKPRDQPKTNQIDEELFLVELEFKRSDNVESSLFKLNVPLKKSFENERNRKDVFHKAHRYNFPSQDFTCEDDHVTCMGILYNFIQDHAQIPITHISSEMFHTQQKNVNYLWKQPVLLALVHANNITARSNFNKVLYDVALRTYAQVAVATLNVDQYPDWSHLFVPRNYYHQTKDSNKPWKLHRYPRFCMINLAEHSKAAFYPPILESNEIDEPSHIKSEFSKENILTFVDEYLSDRRKFIVPTEHF